MLKGRKVVSITSLEWVKIREMLKLAFVITVEHSFNQSITITEEEEEGEPNDLNFITE